VKEEWYEIESASEELDRFFEEALEMTRSSVEIILDELEGKTDAEGGKE